MGVFEKAYYQTWNIGFVESSSKQIISSRSSQITVHWMKHDFMDRFFADPFILSVDDTVIRVLVEDFPYYDKRGMISLLNVDRRTYKLIDKKVILKQPYHMSYPFILRKRSNEVWVAPEASQSGYLYYYSINPNTFSLENRRVLLPEPVLDSTIVEHDGRWWLFCTKRGDASNRDLFIYYADTPEGPWTPHLKNPVTQNACMARPAGYLVKDDDKLYRVIQKCDKYYGEAVIVSQVVTLSTFDFEEVFVKEIRAQKDEYSNCFHTLNGLGNLTVVDGVRRQFAPIRRIVYEIRNKLKV